MAIPRNGDFTELDRFRIYEGYAIKNTMYLVLTSC